MPNEPLTAHDRPFDSAAPRRHHHGWQRPLGGGARAAARAKATGAASRRCARPCARPARSASRYLTIFSFSSENWSRPASEIRDLMGLLRRFIRNDLAELHQNGVRVRIIGERDDLDPDIRRLLEEAEELTTRQRPADAGGRVQLRRPAGDRARGARASPAEVAAGTLDPSDDHRRTARRSTSTRPICPIPISSSAPAASSGCRISCSGRRPTANSCSCRSTGRTSTAPRSKARSPNTAGASAGSAAWSRRPDPDRGRRRSGRGAAGLASWPAAAISRCGSPRRWCWRRSRSRAAYFGGWPFAAVLGGRRASSCCGNGTRWSAAHDRNPVLAVGAVALAGAAVC